MPSLQFDMMTDGVMESWDSQLGPSTSSTFPQKLYVMSVHEFDSPGSGIRWCSNGRAFKVIDPDSFSEEIVPKYFKHAKLTSFQRQLNLYGFRRISKGDDHGAYFHPSFQHGREDLVKNIKRLPVSKNGQSSTREGGDRDGLFEVPTVPTSDPLIEFENLLGGNLEPPAKRMCSNAHSAQPVYKGDEMDCPAPAPTPEEVPLGEGMPKMSKLSMRVGFAKLVASNLMCRAAASNGSDGSAKHMDSHPAHSSSAAPADSTEEPPKFLRMSSVDDIKNILSLTDVAAWRPLGLSQNSSSHGSENTEPDTGALEDFPTFDEAVTFLAGCV